MGKPLGIGVRGKARVKKTTSLVRLKSKTSPKRKKKSRKKEIESVKGEPTAQLWEGGPRR